MNLDIAIMYRDWVDHVCNEYNRKPTHTERIVFWKTVMNQVHEPETLKEILECILDGLKSGDLCIDEEPCNFCGTPNKEFPKMVCARTPICTNKPFGEL